MRFSGETHTAAASTAPSNKGREDISLAMRFPKQEPRCTCRAEGTLRLQRQTGALHLARASPSATRTESGGRAGGGRTMTACWNAAVRCERRSSGACRHGPPEPARGPFPHLAGLGPSASTSDAVTARARVKAQLQLGASRAKGRQTHGCQEFSAGFTSISDAEGLQPFGAGRQEPCWLGRRRPRRQYVIHSFREQGQPPTWCRASHELSAGLASHRLVLAKYTPGAVGPLLTNTEPNPHGRALYLIVHHVEENCSDRRCHCGCRPVRHRPRAAGCCSTALQPCVGCHSMLPALRPCVGCHSMRGRDSAGRRAEAPAWGDAPRTPRTAGP